MTRHKFTAEVMLAMCEAGCTAKQMAEVAVSLEMVVIDADMAQREAARNRKRNQRKKINAANILSPDVTRDMCDISDDETSPSSLSPPDKERSPRPPKEINPPISLHPHIFNFSKAAETKKVLTELERVLDNNRAKAVFEHKAEKGSPLTVQSAKLLASEFEQTDDPNRAADTMIRRGWKDFDRDWIPKQNGSRAAKRPPNTPSEFTIRRNATLEACEAAMKGHTDASRPTESKSDIELGRGDYCYAG